MTVSWPSPDPHLVVQPNTNLRVLSEVNKKDFKDDPELDKNGEYQSIADWNSEHVFD